MLPSGAEEQLMRPVARRHPLGESDILLTPAPIACHPPDV